MTDVPAAKPRADDPAESDSEDANHYSDFCNAYDAYAVEIERGIRSAFGDGPPDPEDVVQEAFRKVFDQKDISPVRNLRAFLWRTARNLVIDIRRSEGVRSKFDFEVEQLFFPLRGENLSPEIVLSAREQLANINVSLQAMPERRRRMFLMRRIDGNTLDKIANEFDVSRTAVVKQIAKADRQIRDAVQKR